MSRLGRLSILAIAVIISLPVAGLAKKPKVTYYSALEYTGRKSARNADRKGKCSNQKGEYAGLKGDCWETKKKWKFIVSAKWWITPETIRPPNNYQTPSSAASKKVYATGCKDDVRGHVLSSVLGGTGAAINMMPITSELNGKMKKLELQARAWAKRWGWASVYVKVKFDGSGPNEKYPARPTEVWYEVRSEECMFGKHKTLHAGGNWLRNRDDKCK